MLAGLNDIHGGSCGRNSWHPSATWQHSSVHFCIVHSRTKPLLETTYISVITLNINQNIHSYISQVTRMPWLSTVKYSP